MDRLVYLNKASLSYKQQSIFSKKKENKSHSILKIKISFSAYKHYTFDYCFIVVPMFKNGWIASDFLTFKECSRKNSS